MNSSDVGFAVQASHLEKIFPASKQTKAFVVALRDINLTVPKASLVALVGPDGAGKTTFMRLVAGLLNPTRGALSVFGLNPQTQPEAVQARISYMPQRFGLYQDLSVRENMDLFADLQGVPKNVRKVKYGELLTMTGLADFSDRITGKLSGGMKQKLALACSLIKDPDLLILDEPTAGVDPLSRQELWKILTSAIRQKGTSVLLSTGYMDEAALCDEVYIINRGVILEQGSPQSLIRPFDGRTFFAAGPGRTPRELQALAASNPSVLDYTPSGDGVRVLLIENADLGLVASQMKVPDLQPIAPRFEDAFMASLIADQGKEKAFGTWESSQTDEKVSDESAPLIVVQDLVKKFGEFTAVDDTSFSVKRGEIFGLLGPNGAGKTTTFKILCGLIPATSGTVEVAGVNLRNARSSARRNIGYVAQFFSLYGLFSVYYNLRFYGGVYGMFGKKAQEAIAQAAERFQLTDVMEEKAGSLNEGFKKRLSMAAALLHDPEILFLDEPTSSIDPLARRVFWQTINQLAQEGKAVIVTTHFMEESEYCTRIAIQDRGRMLALGTPKEVKEKAGLAQTASMNQAFLNIVLQNGRERT